MTPKPREPKSYVWLLAYDWHHDGYSVIAAYSTEQAAKYAQAVHALIEEIKYQRTEPTMIVQVELNLIERVES